MEWFSHNSRRTDQYIGRVADAGTNTCESRGDCGTAFNGVFILRPMYRQAALSCRAGLLLPELSIRPPESTGKPIPPPGRRTPDCRGTDSLRVPMTITSANPNHPMPSARPKCEAERPT